MRSSNWPMISDKLTAVLIISIECILFLLAIYYLVKVVGIYDITPVSTFIENIKNILFSIIGIALAMIIIMLFRASFQCVPSNDTTIYVSPFIVGNFENSYNGQAISELLIAEIEEIRRVLNRAHNNDPERISASTIDQFPPVITPSAQLQTFANLGTISIGPFNVSIGQILIMLKRLNRQPEQVITGSIQKYGSKIHIIAHFNGQDGQKSWMSNGADVVDIVSDLAVKVSEGIYNDPAMLLYDLGIDRIEKRRFPEAEKLFKKAINLKQDANSFFSLGLVLSKLGRKRDALANYDKSIEIDPTKAYFWNNKGNILADLGQFDDAMACFNESIRLDSSSEVTFFNRGFTLYRVGKYNEAVQSYDEAIRIKPSFEYAWTNKGSALSELNRHEEAIKCFDVAIHLDPLDQLNWHNKGLNQNKLKRYEDALKSLRRAINLNFADKETWADMGDSYSGLDNYEEAIEAYESAIAIDPSFDRAWMGKGVALFKLKRKRKALKCFNKAIDLNRNNSRAWYNKGIVLAVQDKNDKALNAFENALKIDKTLEDAWYNKSVVLKRLGRNGDADAALNRAKELGFKDGSPSE